MPFRNLGEYVGKVAFTTSAEMPRLVYLACLKTGTPSNTAYYQDAICERLAHDLDIPIERLRANLPPRRTSAAHLYDPDEHKNTRRPTGIHVEQTGGVFQIGPANTDEQVR